MQPVDFPCRNLTLGPPPGLTEEECRPLPVFFDGRMYVSCWELSDADIEEILKTRKVWLCISNPAHPPVWVDTKPMFEETARFNIGDQIFCQVFIPGEKQMIEASGTIEEHNGTYFINTGETKFPMAYARQFTIIPKEVNA